MSLFTTTEENICSQYILHSDEYDWKQEAADIAVRVESKLKKVIDGI